MPESSLHRYCSYLLRLWPAQRDGQVVWRASLEDPVTGVRRGFADLEQLFAFLTAETRESAAAETREQDCGE